MLVLKYGSIGVLECCIVVVLEYCWRLLECVGVLEYLKECKIGRVQKLEDCENG